MTTNPTVTITLSLDQLREVVRQEVERAMNLRPASVSYDLGTSGKRGVSVKEYDSTVSLANEKAAAVFDQAVRDLDKLGTSASRFAAVAVPGQGESREERG